MVTADDDVFYWKTWLEELYSNFLKHKNVICGHYIHKIKKKSSINFESYNNWTRNITDHRNISHALFACGGGGILYPPHSLPKETYKKKFS